MLSQKYKIFWYIINLNTKTLGSLYQNDLYLWRNNHKQIGIMKNFKDYHVRNIERQEAIHVLGGTVKLESTELDEIASFYGVEDYQVKLQECQSAARSTMGQFEYYSYTIIYNHTVKSAA